MPQAPQTEAPFKIFQASAGAGKTYQLVRRYLLLALAPGSGFSSILAITFTNKATQEMKTRLLKQLLELSRQEQTVQNLAQDLAQELKLPPEKLAQRAHFVLREILHSYGAFSVSTIDSFNNRLVRSFSRDLGLSSQFEVTLDAQPLLEAAVDELLEKLTPQSPLTRWLHSFGQERYEQGKRATYRLLLLDAAADLLQETTLPYLLRLADWQLSDFDDLAQKLHKHYQQKLSKIKEAAQEELRFLAEKGLEDHHFSRKSLPNWLRALAAGNLKPPSATLLKQIQGEATFYAKSNKQGKQAVAPFEEALQERMGQLWFHLEPELPFLTLKPELDQSLYHTAVMLSLEQELQNVIERSQQVPISRFTRLISEHLRHEPAPYLYERLGDRYRFFFIDEFQDTSRLQWQNLVPLINESLSQDPHHRAMVVGDVKQAIYRFRGGDVEQFIDLIHDRDKSHLAPGGQTALYQRETEPMLNNFRSRPELVRFNNALFPFLSKQLAAPEQQEVYQQAQQTPQSSSKGGYVYLTWLSPDTKVALYRQEAVEKTLQQLTELRKRGFQWGQIALLCLKHQQISLLSRRLREWQDPLTGGPVPVNSDRDQTLEASLALRGLVAFYRGQKAPHQGEARLPWAQWLYRQLEVREDEGRFLPERALEPPRSTLAFLDEAFPSWHTARFEALDLVEQLHYLLSFLQPAYQQDPLIMRFLDEVALLRERERADAHTLLRWWDQTGHKLKIPSTATDALRLITLHAAKGLEFPVVIMPFVGDNTAGAQSHWGWEEIPKNTEAAPLPAARLKHTSSLKNGLPPEHWMAQRIQQYQQKEELDGLNRFYVGCTRAVQELHLICKGPKGDKQATDLIPHLPAFLKAFSESHNLMDPPGGEVAQWGQPTQAPEEASQQKANPLQPYPIRPWRQRLKVSDAAPEVWHEPAAPDARQMGLKLHRLLAQIKSADDLKSTMQKAEALAEFPQGDMESLYVYLKDLLGLPQLLPFFSPQAEVLTERAILLPQGYQKIPDRLVFHDGQVHLLDYKTGKQDPQHQEQLASYTHLLTEAGYSVGQCLLVYLHQPPLITELST
jgi:ATP-dependent exoDNAse (exonuclease V) beta subunit